MQVEVGTHTDRIVDLAVDARRRLAISGGADHTARLWHLSDGTPAGILRLPASDGGRGEIRAVALSPDGKLAAVGGVAAGTVRDTVFLFDTQTGRLVSRLQRQSPGAGATGVDGLHFDRHGGGRLAVRYQPDGAIAWFSVPDGALAARGPERSPFDQADRKPTLTADLGHGRRLAAGDEGQLSLTDANGHPIWQVVPRTPLVRRLDVTPDGAVIRIVEPAGELKFKVSEMDDDVDGDPGFGAGPPPGQPAPLPDGGRLVGDRSRLLRVAANGTPRWQVDLDSRVRAVNATPDGRIAVAALGDGTVRWFDGATGRERVALFLRHGGEDWAAWTPEGFFDHSDSQEDWYFSGWLVDHGPNQAPALISIAQMYEVAYRPDLIRQAYAGDGPATQAITSGEAAAPRSRLAHGLPPAVTLAVIPATDRRSAEITVSARDQGAGLGKGLARINGVVVAVEPAAAAPGPAWSFRRSVALRQGGNQIEAVVFDRANEIESAPTRTVVSDGKGSTGIGDLYALVVGVDHYPDPDMQLSYAVADGRAIAAELKRASAPAFRQVHVDGLFEADARIETIARRIQTMGEGMAQTDTFVLFLAGHGINLQGRFHFLPYDVQHPTLEEVTRHGLTQERLQDLLLGVPADRALVVLDACYSGGVGRIQDRSVLMRTAHRRLARATGRSFLSAATDTQLATEGYHGHGLLTFVVLQGLSGAATGPGAATVTARQLGSYALKAVPEIARQAFGTEQLPVFNLFGRDFPIANAAHR